MVVAGRHAFAGLRIRGWRYAGASAWLCGTVERRVERARLGFMGLTWGWAGKGFMGLTLVLPLLQVHSSLIVARGVALLGSSSSSDVRVASLTVFGSSEVVMPLARD